MPGPNARVKSASRSSPDHGGVDLLHLVAERLEQRRRASRAAASQTGSSVAALERHVQREPDPQPARSPARPRRTCVGRGAAAPRSRRRARSRRARRARAVSRTVRVSTPSLTRKLCPPSGPTRHPSAGGLETDQPAARGGDPDRTAAVVAVGDRHHPCRHRGRRAAARSSGRAVERPTGCGSARSAATRSSAGSPSRAAWSCRRSRTRRPAGAGRGTRRGRRRSRRTARCTS